MSTRAKPFSVIGLSMLALILVSGVPTTAAPTFANPARTLLITTDTNAGWEEVGDGSATDGCISGNNGRSGSSSVAIALDGMPYVAWEDDSGGNREIYVRRWNGGSWEEVGIGSASGGGISDTSEDSYDPSIAIAPDGTPYVAWGERLDFEDYQVHVRRWTGSSWEDVGPSWASDSLGCAPSLVVAPNGTIYIAYKAEDGRVHVRRWNGSAWEEVGTTGWYCDIYGQPSLAIAPDSAPYIAWVDDSGGQPQLWVRRWNGSDWENVGPSWACDFWVTPLLAIAPDGTPYGAWEDSSSGEYGQIYVQRWNGSTWEEVGTSILACVYGQPALAIVPDGTPYIAWEDCSGGDSEIYVRRWNGSTWEETEAGSASNGGISNNSGGSTYPSLAIASDGTSYIAWTDVSDGDAEIYVRRWRSVVVPENPTLHPIDNSDCDGDYTVSWSSIAEASYYELDEDDNLSFSSPVRQYVGSGNSWNASGKAPGTYYYRVRACNDAGFSEWSLPKLVRVWAIPSPPLLHPIDNTDQDGDYVVRWEASADASTYTLEESASPLFDVRETDVYTIDSTHYEVTDQHVGTFYYRVRASNCRGTGDPSNTESVTVVSGVDVRVRKIELTQAIQHLNLETPDEDPTIDNSIPLIAGKTTYVRVYVELLEGNGPISGITGRLCATTSDTSLGCELPLRTIAVRQHDDWDSVRGNWYRTLNFKLPRDWTTRDRIILSGTVTLPDVAIDIHPTNNTFTKTVNFRQLDVPTLDVVAVIIRNKRPEFDIRADRHIIAPATEWVSTLYPVDDTDGIRLWAADGSIEMEVGCDFNREICWQWTLGRLWLKAILSTDKPHNAHWYGFVPCLAGEQAIISNAQSYIDSGRYT